MNCADEPLPLDSSWWLDRNNVSRTFTNCQKPESGGGSTCITTCFDHNKEWDIPVKRIHLGSSSTNTQVKIEVFAFGPAFVATFLLLFVLFIFLLFLFGPDLFVVCRNLFRRIYEFFRPFVFVVDVSSAVVVVERNGGDFFCSKVYGDPLALAFG